MRINKLDYAHYYPALKTPFKNSVHNMHNDDDEKKDVVEIQGKDDAENKPKKSFLGRMWERFLQLMLLDVDDEEDDVNFEDDLQEENFAEEEFSDDESYIHDKELCDDFEDFEDDELDYKLEDDEFIIDNKTLGKVKRRYTTYGILATCAAAAISHAIPNMAEIENNKRNEIVNYDYVEEFQENPVGTANDFLKSCLENDEYSITYGAEQVHSTHNRMQTMTGYKEDFSLTVEYPNGLRAVCDFRNGVNSQIANEFPIGMIKDAGYLERAGFDINGDGRADIVYYFDNEGEKQKMLLDVDLDGRLDVEFSEQKNYVQNKI